MRIRIKTQTASVIIETAEPMDVLIDEVRGVRVLAPVMGEDIIPGLDDLTDASEVRSVKRRTN